MVLLLVSTMIWQLFCFAVCTAITHILLHSERLCYMSKLIQSLLVLGDSKLQWRQKKKPLLLIFKMQLRFVYLLLFKQSILPKCQHFSPLTECWSLSTFSCTCWVNTCTGQNLRSFLFTHTSLQRQTLISAYGKAAFSFSPETCDYNTSK